MNFDEWFDDYIQNPKVVDNDEKDWSRAAWNGAKKEIIKLIKKYDNSDEEDNDICFDKYVLEKINNI